EVAAVERVGLLSSGEARVLADRPRLGRVHRRVRPAQERRQAGKRVQRIESLKVVGGVEALDLDPLGGQPRLAREALGSTHFYSSSRSPRRKANASRPIAA